MRPSFCLIVALLICTAAYAEEQHGTIVLLLVSRQDDYVVVAADSRTVNENDAPIDDNSCKIISLGEKTLFFATETVSFAFKRRGQIGASEWNAAETARSLYRTYGKDTSTLAGHWAKDSARMFALWPEDKLRSGQESDGGLANGMFVRYVDGKSIVWDDTVVHRSGPSNVVGTTTVDDSAKLGYFGLASDLVQEFYAGNTKRSAEARHACCLGPLGVDADSDVRLVEAAVKFAITYASREDKDKVGLPIDIAILYRDKPVRWVARKKICYKEDAN